MLDIPEEDIFIPKSYNSFVGKWKACDQMEEVNIFQEDKVSNQGLHYD